MTYCASAIAPCFTPIPLRSPGPAFSQAPRFFDSSDLPFADRDVDEFAVRLINSRSPGERDHLIGAILTHAAIQAGAPLSASEGRALGGLLKSIAGQGFARRRPGRALGLELEAYEHEELEYEAARRFVRLAGHAAQHCVEEPLPIPPRTSARAALAAGAEIYAPPLVLTLARSNPGFRQRRRQRRFAQWRAAATAFPPPRPVPIDIWFEPFDYDPDMEYFLGGLIHSVGRAVSGAAKAIGKFGPVRDIAKTVRAVSRTVDKVASAVGKIPIVGDVARGALGVARVGFGPYAMAIDAGIRLANGENLGKALKGAVRGQIDAVRDQLKLAEMVAPFIPGIGSGVAAALGAANALAAGRPITEALISAGRAAVPGGRIAQAAFDVASNLAKGKNIGEAALNAARNQLPGGAAARAAFDGALALAQGKNIQDAAFAAAGRILPPSPYAADALEFVKKVSKGQNIQNAALSVAGQRLIRRARANSVAGPFLRRAA
jgi:hypothetical protein